MRWIHGTFVTLTLLFAACEVQNGGSGEGSSGAEEDTTRESEGETTVELVRDEGTDAPAAEGRTCTSSADCGDDEMCSGDEGCDVAWTCQPVRPCTRDLRVYCGCDGQTFEGSGSCPPRPFASRGPCEAAVQ